MYDFFIRMLVNVNELSVSKVKESVCGELVFYKKQEQISIQKLFLARKYLIFYYNKNKQIKDISW